MIYFSALFSRKNALAVYFLLFSLEQTSEVCQESIFLHCGFSMFFIKIFRFCIFKFQLEKRIALLRKDLSRCSRTVEFLSDFDHSRGYVGTLAIQPLKVTLFAENLRRYDLSRSETGTFSSFKLEYLIQRLEGKGWRTLVPSPQCLSPPPFSKFGLALTSG